MSGIKPRVGSLRFSSICGAQWPGVYRCAAFQVTKLEGVRI